MAIPKRIERWIVATSNRLNGFERRLESVERRLTRVHAQLGIPLECGQCGALRLVQSANAKELKPWTQTISKKPLTASKKPATTSDKRPRS